ncbi:MAG: site-2 protease family protein [Nitrospirae bacterium]|nr:site-2 protease family protein [Nitrospirota bacterium]
MDLASILHRVSVVALPILVAITFHEAAHGFVAHRRGDPTAKYLGRLTLNPLAHIDPFGTVLLPLLLYLMPLLLTGQPGVVFGYAKPVPVNFMNLRRPKSDMIWVAAAGPMTNLALAVLSGVLLRVLLGLGGLGGGDVDLFDRQRAAFAVVQPLAQMLQYSVFINVALMLFNLLPIPPLDGGRVMVGVLPGASSERLARMEPYGMLIIFMLLFLDPLHLVYRILVPLSETLIRWIL